MTRLLVLAGALIALAASTPTLAAPLTAADRAWIDKCVADRKGGGPLNAPNNTASLRKYCTCIHEVVEDNQPFGITEFERSYPPVHRECWAKYRMKPD